VELLVPRGLRPSGWVHLGLWLSARPEARRAAATIAMTEHRLPLDVGGDAMGLAVAIEHWLRSEGLPWFDCEPDLEALARAAEARDARRDCCAQWEAPRIAALWRLAGRPDEAERVERAASQTGLPARQPA
jgi:hypothetical protein